MNKKFLSSLLIPLLILSFGAASGADYATGFAAFSEGNYETALAEWAPLAEQGDANSQFGMGLLSANGWASPQDDAKALQWYELAAAQGHAEASYNIGVMYQNGWGVEQNDAEALKSMQRSAENGFAAANRALGDTYENGVGVEPDNVQAYMWFETGAAMGDSQSNFDREELAASMDASDVSSAEELARAWLAEFRAQHPAYVWPDE